MKRIALSLAVGCLLAASARAQGVGGGLVGFYVYPHPSGVIINSFIPQSSAWQMHQQGQLFSGDVVTRYNGQPIRSAEDIRRISAQSPPGQWLRMDFQTPNGQPFWLWVQPGGGAPVAAAAAPGAPAPQPQAQPYRMKVGSGRPGAPAQPGAPVQPGSPAPKAGTEPSGPGRPK